MIGMAIKAMAGRARFVPIEPPSEREPRRGEVAGAPGPTGRASRRAGIRERRRRDDA